VDIGRDGFLDAARIYVWFMFIAFGEKEGINCFVFRGVLLPVLERLHVVPLLYVLIP
jgi:hypothetical protein